MVFAEKPEDAGGATRGVVGFRGWVSVSVADGGFGCGEGVAFGVEEAHGVFGEVAPVGDLPLVVEVGEDGADGADGGGLVGEDPRHP